MAGMGFLRKMARHGAGILLALGLAGAVEAWAVTVKVSPDTATLVHVAGKPATLIVGNPLFADAAAIGNQILVQGRNYGKTNIIVLDAKGQRLAQFDVVVAPDMKGQMIVYREGRRYTYACNPTCARQLDTSDTLEEVLLLGKAMNKRQQLISSVIDSGGGGSAPTVVSPQ